MKQNSLRWLVACSFLLLTGVYSFGTSYATTADRWGGHFDDGSSTGATWGTNTDDDYGLNSGHQGVDFDPTTGSSSATEKDDYNKNYNLQIAGTYKAQGNDILDDANRQIQGVGQVYTGTYKEAMQAAEAKIANIEAMMTNAVTEEQAKAIFNLWCQSQAEKKQLLEKVGDPVIISTGEFTESTADLTISCNILQFPILRSYRTSNIITGSLGYGWVSTLDQRLIPGAPVAVEEMTGTITSCLDELNAEVANLTARFRTTYGSDNLATAKQQLQAKQSKAAQGLTEAQEAKELYDKANSLYRTYGQSQVDTSFIQSFTALKNSYDQALKSIDGDYAAITSRKQRIAEIQSQYKEYLTYRVPSTVFPGTPEYFYENGTSTVTVITPTGDPVLFRTAGQNLWTAEGNQILRKHPDGQWQLTQRDGTVKTYDAAGFFCGQQDRNGNSISLERDAETGQLTAITTGNGETFTVSHTEQGFISAITSARDDTWKVTYGYGQNLLTSFTDADNFSTRFSYDSHHTLTAIQKTDGSAIRLKLEYGEDGTGKVTATTNEEGISETFSYTPNEQSAWFTDHDGNHTRYLFDSQGHTIQTDNAAAGRCTNQWNADGRLVSETRNGKTNRFQYNASGDLQRASYSDGTVEQWVWNDSGDLLTHQDRTGTIKTYDRDIRGNITLYRENGTPVTRCTYDRYGRMTSREELGDTSSVTTYTWDTWGNLASSTLLGDTYTYRYDTRNRLTAIAVNGKDIETRSYTDRITTVSKENGLTSTFTLDDRKNLISVEHRDIVTGEIRTTGYVYDRQHNPILETLNGIPRTACRYSGEGRPLSRIMFAPEQSQVTCWTWEGDSVAQQQVFSVTGSENAALYANPELWQTVSTDYLMQLAQKRNDFFIQPVAPFEDDTDAALPDNPRDTYDSRGRLTCRLFGPSDSKAGADYYEEYQYTDNGRTIIVTRGGKYPMIYGLNAFGEVISRTDGNGKATTFELSAEGKPLSVTLPLGQTTSYTYDCAGNIVCIAQPDGSTVSYAYTALGVLTGITTSAGTESIVADTTETSGTSKATVSSVLTDTSGLAYNRIGNVTRAVTDTTDLAFIWDQAGLLTEQKDLITGITTTWTYDATGRPATVTMQRQGATVSRLVYRWDANGNMTALQDTVQNLSVSCVYDSLNRETERKYGNGTVLHTRYDGAGRKSAVWTTGPQGETVSAEALLYDPVTGRKTASITHEGNLTLYTYTAEGQLKTVRRTVSAGEFSSSLTRMQVVSRETVTALKKIMTSISPTLGNRVPSTAYMVTETYTYDSHGNRVSQSTTAGTTRYTYDDHDRLISSVNTGTGKTTTYQWDTEGNLVLKKESSRQDRYTYDDRNRLTKVEITTATDTTPRTQIISYEYDALGRRYSTTTNGTTVYQVYDGVTFAVTGELYDMKETPKSRYRWNDDSGKETGSRVRLYVNGNPAAEKRGTAATYLSSDSTGSITLETDQYGRKQAVHRYDVFGMPTS